MWPFKSEKRQAVGGGYTEAVSTLIYAQAVGTAQNASERRRPWRVSPGRYRGHLRALKYWATPEIARAVSPRCLGQIGRDLVRVGESLHVIRYMGGRLMSDTGEQRGTGKAAPTQRRGPAPRRRYGPSGSSTWRVPQGVGQFILPGEVANSTPLSRAWDRRPGQSETARLSANAERALADEAGGPVAQLLAGPARRRRRRRRC